MIVLFKQTDKYPANTVVNSTVDVKKKFYTFVHLLIIVVRVRNSERFHRAQLLSDIFTFESSKEKLHRKTVHDMSAVPKDIYCYSLENSFSFDWAEIFFLHVVDP